MIKLKISLLLVAIALLVTSFAAAEKHDDWLERVPQKDRFRPNPLTLDDAAPAAGAIIFAERCASCHGADAQGKGRRPSLRTDRVREATDGELQWLLRNGSLGKGMPAWSGLPEVQRWQLIRYLRSLSMAPALGTTN